MMPADGWPFRVEQRDPSPSSIPAVVVSADGRAPDGAAAIGAVGYLEKPIDFTARVETARRRC